MTLFLIGLGLQYVDDLSIRAINALKACDVVFLEGYTSVMSDSVELFEKIIGKPVRVLDRKGVEESFDVLSAKDKNVALCVIGDVFSATTHFTLFMEAKKHGVDVEVIHNVSVLNAVSITGLSLYKFGKTISVCYQDEDYAPKDFYKDMVVNKENNMHTLCLLDIKVDQKRFMTVSEGLDILLGLEKEFGKGLLDDTSIVIGVARLGSKDFIVKSGTVDEVKKFNFGAPVHSLIIPSTLNHIEEEAIEMWKR